MNDIDSWLRECVYYPCSELHGVPVKFLGKRFQRFFYADYSVDREHLDKSIVEGFKGYKLNAKVEITPDAIFGMPWKDFEHTYERTISQLPFKWSAPFMVLCRFERAVDLNDDHGPAAFEFMFGRSEAIATFRAAFSRRNIAPKCLVHIRSGIGFGGNYSAYPRDLRTALLENRGGLPAYMLYDNMGSSATYGDYLDLVKRYRQIERWGYPDGGHLTLAELIASDGEQGVPADSPRAARSARG